MLTDKMLQAFFDSPLFQSGYKKQLEKFGEDIDKLFAEDLRAKITFSNEVLSKMMLGKLHQAYMSITHFTKLCKSDEERQILDRLISICSNEDDMAGVREGDFVFSEQFGYYKVINKTHSGAIIKKAFSANMSFTLYDPRSGLRFTYKEENLNGYRAVSKKDLAKIDGYFEKNPEHHQLFHKNTELILRLREAIKQGGMTEAEEGFKMLHFYKLCGEKLAFIINLTDLGDKLRIGYGFAAVSGEEYLNHMAQFGIDDDWINLRECQFIGCEDELSDAFSALRAFYEKHISKSKDEILALRQERRKAFIDRVKATLKPLDFKKKNSTWTKDLGDGISFKIVLDKSQFSDIFSFCFWVMHEGDEGVYRCYSTSLYDYGQNRFDWQFATEEELSHTMKRLEEMAKEIISNHKALVKKGSEDLNEVFVCQRTGRAVCKGCPYKI